MSKKSVEIAKKYDNETKLVNLIDSLYYYKRIDYSKSCKV